MKKFTSCFVLLLLTVATADVSFAQSLKERVRYQQKVEIDFEILSIENAHVTTSERCYGLKFVVVYVSPSGSTEVKIRDFARKLISTFPDEFDLMITFIDDRKYLESSRTDEDEIGYFKATRGIFVRSIGRAVDLGTVFPNGTSRDELDLLFPEN